VSRGAGGAARGAAWLGALLCLAPALATAALLARAAVDVPAFDDYDAVVDFLNRWVAAPGAGARTRLLFAQHIEHRPALLRAAAAAVFAAQGHVDLRALQAFGALGLVLLAAALFASFRPGAPPRERWLPFAPAALVLFHPQFWSAYLWPTCSATNFYAVAFAALAFRALAGRGTGSFALAAASATAATFSQGNGVLALPLGLAVLGGAGARARRRAWIAFSLALGATTLLAFERPFTGWSAVSNLASPLRVAGFALHFLGGAPTFSQRGLAPVAGAALVASFGLLLARGALRRSPALLALQGFLLASALLNALVRAQQGVAAPLVQDRYRFYACAYLAATWLAWAAELAGTRREHPLVRAGVATALAFSLASHALYRGELLDLSRRLTAGYERWWLRGDGGLFYPRFAAASAMLTTGFERGVLRIPPAWLAAHAQVPREAALPEAGPAVRFRLGALRLDAGGLLAEGWAQVGGSVGEPRVALVLRSPERSLVVPTHAVPRLGPEGPAPAGGAGFRSLVRRADLPPGEYRVGVLVERADGAWLSFRGDALAVPGGVEGP
jgi:hypothetical protein